MGGLSNNWVTDGWIDFEFKKYLVLGYLQDVNRSFEQKKLYPFLSDLIFHYQNLLVIKNNQKLLYDQFPERMTKTDFEKLNMVYDKIVADDSLMAEIVEIIEFATPEFKKHVDNGREIYDGLEKHIEISPIGLTPLYPDEGYIFVLESNKSETKIFEYQVTIFHSANENYRGIRTNFIDSFTRSIGRTLESVKIELIKKYNKLPNPATYLIDSKISIPLDESLMPIAKRMLVRYINNSYSY